MSATSYDQLFTPNTLAALTDECGDSLPTTYIESLRQRYESQAIYVKILNPMAQWVEPGDPMFGYNQVRFAERTFRYGGVVGLRVAEACGKLTLLQTMARINPLSTPAPSVEKSEQFQFIQGAHYLDLGNAEYANLCAATDETSIAFCSLLKAWAPQVAEEAYAERFFGAGFGTMAYYARRGIELPDYEQMAKGSLSEGDLTALLQNPE